MNERDEMKARISAKILSGEIGPRPVARLDKSKPPPGYRGLILVLAYIDNTSQRVPGTDEAKTDAEAIAACWTHHQGSNDPPGLETLDCPGGGAVFGYVRDGWPEQAPGGWATRTEARAAAWAWYWRRVKLIERAETIAGQRGCRRIAGADDGWAEILAWSDAHVAAEERDLDAVEAVHRG